MANLMTTLSEAMTNVPEPEAKIVFDDINRLFDSRDISNKDLIKDVITNEKLASSMILKLNELLETEDNKIKSNIVFDILDLVIPEVKYQLFIAIAWFLCRDYRAGAISSMELKKLLGE